MPENYVISKSAEIATKAARLERVNGLINKAVLIRNEFDNIDKEFNEMKFLQKVVARHESNLKAVKALPRDTEQYDKKIASTEKEGIMKLINNRNQQKRNIVNKKAIQLLLNRLKNTGIEGYQVIVQLRETVTGQELIYHIHTRQGNKDMLAYTLTENEYIELLKGQSLGGSYGESMWNKLQKAKQEGTSFVASDFFNLQVGGTEKNLSKVAKNKSEPINLSKDILYQYLLIADKNKAAILDKDGKTNYSRLAELHSQLSANYEWRRDSSGTILPPPPNSESKFFFTMKRQKVVDAFIGAYKKSNLHADTDKFYETGDAILNDEVLIENKVGNARISLSTIRNAIEAIAELQGASMERFKQGFIAMFTKSPKKGGLAEKLQKGAYETALESIQNLFKS